MLSFLSSLFFLLPPLSSLSPLSSLLPSPFYLLLSSLSFLLPPASSLLPSSLLPSLSLSLSVCLPLSLSLSVSLYLSSSISLSPFLPLSWWSLNFDGLISPIQREKQKIPWRFMWRKGIFWDFLPFSLWGSEIKLIRYIWIHISFI